MKLALGTIALAVTFAAPTFAASGSCTDFMGMTEGQSTLLSDLLTDDPVAADAMVSKAREACMAHPDMMIDEAMEMMDAG